MTNLEEILKKILVLQKDQKEFFDVEIEDFKTHFDDIEEEIGLQWLDYETKMNNFMEQIKKFKQEELRTLSINIDLLEEIKKIIDEMLNFNDFAYKNLDQWISAEKQLRKRETEISKMIEILQKAIEKVKNNLTKEEDLKIINTFIDAFNCNQTISMRFPQYPTGKDFKVKDNYPPQDFGITIPNIGESNLVALQCEILNIDFNRGELKGEITISRNLISKKIIVKVSGYIELDRQAKYNLVFFANRINLLHNNLHKSKVYNNFFNLEINHEIYPSDFDIAIENDDPDVRIEYFVSYINYFEAKMNIEARVIKQNLTLSRVFEDFEFKENATRLLRISNYFKKQSSEIIFDVDKKVSIHSSWKNLIDNYNKSLAKNQDTFELDWLLEKFTWKGKGVDNLDSKIFIHRDNNEDKNNEIHQYFEIYLKDHLITRKYFKFIGFSQVAEIEEKIEKDQPFTFETGLNERNSDEKKIIIINDIHEYAADFDHFIDIYEKIVIKNLKVKVHWEAKDYNKNFDFDLSLSYEKLNFRYRLVTDQADFILGNQNFALLASYNIFNNKELAITFYYMANANRAIYDIDLTVSWECFLVVPRKKNEDPKNDNQ